MSIEVEHLTAEEDIAPTPVAAAIVPRRVRFEDQAIEEDFPPPESMRGPGAAGPPVKPRHRRTLGGAFGGIIGGGQRGLMGSPVFWAVVVVLALVVIYFVAFRGRGDRPRKNRMRAWSPPPADEGSASLDPGPVPPPQVMAERESQARADEQALIDERAAERQEMFGPSARSEMFGSRPTPKVESSRARFASMETFDDYYQPQLSFEGSLGSATSPTARAEGHAGRAAWQGEAFPDSSTTNMQLGLSHTGLMGAN